MAKIRDEVFIIAVKYFLMKDSIQKCCFTKVNLEISWSEKSMYFRMGWKAGAVSGKRSHVRTL